MHDGQVGDLPALGLVLPVSTRPHPHIDILFAHLSRSEALEAAIRRRVEHLTQYCSDLHACRVVVEQTQRHAHQGRPVEVRVDVTLNGQELVANRSRHEDVYVAVRDAFDDMSRQLEEAVRRRRAGPHHRETVRRGAGLTAANAGFSAVPPIDAVAAEPSAPAARTDAPSSR